jgi:hypothetical protein
MIIEDVIEGGIKTVLGFIFEFLYRLIAELFLFYTGEIVLYFLTFGRKKPRWNAYTKERPMKFWVLTDISTFIGLVFWLVLLWFVGSKL